MKKILFLVTLLYLALGSAHATTILANGCRNPMHPGGGTFGGITYVNYGGATAIGDGVTDDTQALRDMLFNSRNAGSGGWWDSVACYLPPGNYLCSSILVLRSSFLIFGEPSNRPTITLKSSSSFYSSGANPFIVFDPSYGHPANDYTVYTQRDSGTYTSTNNSFNNDLRDVNVTIQSGNPGCAIAVSFGCAQQSSLRNMTITGDSATGCCLQVGEPLNVTSSSGSGGGIVYNITTSGGQAAFSDGAGSYNVIRGCTFNGPSTCGNTAMNMFIGCTFNNSGGHGLDPSNSFVLLDCPFGSGTTVSTGSGIEYHIENSGPSGSVIMQQTSGTNSVWYNGTLENGNSSNLDAAGVAKGSAFFNPSYPYAPSGTTLITATGDITSALNTVFATAGASAYVPPGSYTISSAVTIGANQGLYGAGSANTKFNVTGTIGFDITGNGSGPVVLSNFEATGSAGTMLRWNGDPNSQVLDVLLGPSGGNSGPCAAFQSGGGLIENAWWNASNVSGGTSTGLDFTGTGAIYCYSVAPEHYIASPFILSSAQNVTAVGLQFEIPSWTNSSYFLQASGGSQNYIIGMDTSGDGPAAKDYYATLTSSPDISLWICRGLNSSVHGGVFENSTAYGAASTDLVGFVHPSTVNTSFIQGAIGKDSTGTGITSITASFPSQTAGNTNVIIVSYHSASVAMASSNPLVDTKGNVYSVASPLKAGGADSQIIYYCPSIAASSGTNTVTATFASAVPYVSLRIAEYKGLGGFDVHSEGSGSAASTTASVASVTTTNASDVIVVGVACSNGLNGTVPGFTEQLNASPLSSDLQDDSPHAIFTAFTAPSPIMSSTSWVENLVAFFPAGAVPATPGTLSTVGFSTPATPGTLNTAIQ